MFLLFGCCPAMSAAPAKPPPPPPSNPLSSEVLSRVMSQPEKKGFNSITDPDLEREMQLA